MSVFAIADLHLSLGANKPMDIFSGWTNYLKRLEKNWKSLVTENDTVVIAGDISWAMRLDEIYNDLFFLEKLPGKKILLKGNHDYWWGTKKKIDDYLKENKFSTISILFNNAYKAEHFSICGTRGWFYDSECEKDIKILNREVGRLGTSITVAEKFGLEPIVFLHYPPVYGDIECREIINVLIDRNIKKCYYGHLHGENVSRYAIIGDYKGIEMHLVSCDYTGFMPILIR